MNRLPLLLALLLLSLTPQTTLAQEHQKPVTLMPVHPKLGEAPYGTNALYLNNIHQRVEIVVQVGNATQWTFLARHENEHLIFAEDGLEHDTAPFQVCAWEVGYQHQQSCIYIDYDAEWERGTPLPVNSLGHVWVNDSILKWDGDIYIPSLFLGE